MGLRFWKADEFLGLAAMVALALVLGIDLKL
jgi:hypothetical protein